MNVPTVFREEHRETILHLLALLTVFSLLYIIRGAWQPDQIFADEPAYIFHAITSWNERQGSSIMFSPFYHDLITPFVAVFFEQETGFAVWKFVLFYGTSVLVYFVIGGLTRSWVGLIAAIHMNFMIVPIMSGTYLTLALAWMFLALLVLVKRPGAVGLAAGVMLVGLHIRGEFSLILAAFLFLCAVFASRSVFSRRFVMQIIPGVVVFVALVYWHGSTLAEYPRAISLRGSFAYHHQISKTMTEMGYLAKYTDKKWGAVEMEALDKAYLEQFGKTQTEFREQGGFNLLEMYAASPDLIREHFRQVLIYSMDTFPESVMLELAWPTQAYSIRQILVDRQRVVLAALGIHGVFLLMAILPIVLDRFRGRLRPALCAPITRTLVFGALTPLAAIPAWFLATPLTHYLILLFPAYYLVFVLLLRRFFPRVIGCSDEGKSMVRD